MEPGILINIKNLLSHLDIVLLDTKYISNYVEVTLFNDRIGPFCEMTKVNCSSDM